MTVSTSQQLNVFLVCIVFGISSGVLFDFGRSLRKVYGGKNIATIVEDVIFSTFYIAALIVLCYHFDEGRIRYYHLLGAFFGMLFYALLLSRIFLKIFCTNVVCDTTQMGFSSNFALFASSSEPKITAWLSHQPLIPCTSG